MLGGTTRARVRGARGPARRGRDDGNARGGAAGATRRADAGAGPDMSVPATRDVGSATTAADSVVGFLTSQLWVGTPFQK